MVASDVQCQHSIYQIKEKEKEKGKEKVCRLRTLDLVPVNVQEASKVAFLMV